MKRFRTMKAYLIFTLILGVFILPGCGGNAGNGHWEKPAGTPTVSSTVPANNATLVAFGNDLTATFSEAMDPATISTTTFTLLDGVTPINGSVSYAGVTAVFNPTNPLDPDTLFTATITTGATDVAGNALASDYVWTFRTGIAPDITPPSLTSTVPIDLAIDVATNSALTATFSEAMALASINTTTFSLMETISSAPVNGSVGLVGATATFTPTLPLTAGTNYTATVTTGAQDLALNALDFETSWSFTTAAAPDTTPPTITSTIPIDTATGVAIDSTINATFNEAMAPLTISTATFSLMETLAPFTPVVGTVNLVGMEAIFTPNSLLALNTEYTATVTTGAQDLALNPLDAETSWSFTTATAAPTITMTDPIDQALAVPVLATIKATFSLDMDSLTLTTTTFTVQKSGPPLGLPIAGTVSYDVPTKTATFTPDLPLDAVTEYTATVTNGAKDTLGNALVSDPLVPNPWIFTTGAAVVTIIPGAICPTDAGPAIPTATMSNPTDGNLLATTSTTGVVGGGKEITATFSLAMDPLTIESAIPGALSTFTLKETVSGSPFPGTVAMDATNTIATFTSSAALTEDMSYTVSITTDAMTVGPPATAIACPYEWTFKTVTPPAAGLAPVNMTGIESFGVLGGLSITLGGGPASTTGFRVDGDVGVSPGGTCNGCDSTTVTGVISVADAVAAAAKVALVAAYDDAIGRTVDVCTLATDDLSTGPTAVCALGSGGTFYPGLYWSGTSISIPVGGTITLDALGDPNAVFIFQSESTIITNVNSHVILAGLANANNVFWVGKSSATIGGTGADFAGTVLVLEDFTVNQNTQMLGRALARNGNVTVQDLALITVPTP